MEIPYFFIKICTSLGALAVSDSKSGDDFVYQLPIGGGATAAGIGCRHCIYLLSTITGRLWQFVHVVS